MSASAFSSASDSRLNPHGMLDGYRRATDNLFQYPHKLEDPIGITYYDQEFYAKPSARRTPIRTGTASGERNNKPHPTKEFMGWHGNAIMAWYEKPLVKIKNPNSSWSRELTDDAIKKDESNTNKSVRRKSIVSCGEQSYANKDKALERSVKFTQDETFFIAKKKNKNLNKLNSSSSSSDDCEILGVSGKGCQSLISIESEDTLEKSERMQESHVESPRIRRKPKKGKLKNHFIDDEADLSTEDEEMQSADEHDEKDEYDLRDSFLDLQDYSHNESMLGKYRESLKNPITRTRNLRPITDSIYSQAPETDDSYELDSFCVSEEAVIEKAKTKKSKKKEAVEQVIKPAKKMGRVDRLRLQDHSCLTLSSNDEDELDFAKKPKIEAKVKESVIAKSESVNYENSFKSEQASFLADTSIKTKSSINSSCSQPYWVIMDASQLTSSAELIRNLRRSHDKFRVIIESGLNCDLIVSQRCAIVKFKWSDVGAASYRNTMIDKVTIAKQYYPYLVVLIEDDRDLNSSKNRTKYFDSTLFHLTELATIMFTKYKSERIVQNLFQLCNIEARNGFGISVDCQSILMSKKMDILYYTSLPDISFINAVFFCSNYKKMSDFCNSSVELLKSNGKLSDRKARKLYNFLNS